MINISKFLSFWNIFILFVVLFVTRWLIKNISRWEAPGIVEGFVFTGVGFIDYLDYKKLKPSSLNTKDEIIFNTAIDMDIKISEVQSILIENNVLTIDTIFSVQKQVYLNDDHDHKRVQDHLKRKVSEKVSYRF